jgi:hypothetical protein
MALTTFEKCRLIREIIIRKAAEVMTYTNWSADFALNYIREIPTDLPGRHPELELTGIQPAELTDAECSSLGFGRWTSDSPMRLIPLWLLPFLADEIQTTCISGKETFRRDQIDNDNRFGCLAYGIVPCDVASLQRTT